MSISGAVANALSGLTASARSAEVVSTNIANAMTDGYGRREIVLGNRQIGAGGKGVQVVGVDRIVDQTAIGERRLARARLGATQTEAGFHSQLEAAIGRPGEPGALSERIAAFEGALAEAASRPSDGARLQAVADAGQNLAGAMNLISTEITTIRMTADREIAQQVSDVNDTLTRIAGLNAEIRLQQGAGRDIAALLDERQRLIDHVSQHIPIREFPRSDGSVALFSTAGTGLLEGERAAELGFDPALTMAPGMTVENGRLSGLTLDGVAIATSGNRQPLGGGSLGAQFAVRDSLGPAAQTQIDALARDLYDRFADPAVDPTLAPDAAGLFTDAGAPLDPAEETGLAGRIALSALVDPDQGGALWRLRDGLGAAAEGAVGEARLLGALGAALAAPRVPATGSFVGGAMGANNLAAELLSQTGVALQDAEADAAFAQFQTDGYDRAIAEIGVDSDTELQKLMLVEQAYAANARVLQTVEDMINRLLNI